MTKGMGIAKCAEGAAMALGALLLLLVVVSPMILLKAKARNKRRAWFEYVKKHGCVVTGSASVVRDETCWDCNGVEYCRPYLPEEG